jgi:hypothetical protein
MPQSPKSSEHVQIGVTLLFLKTVVGLALVFVLAAIAAPSLFDRRETLAVVGAFALWLICPLLLFYVGYGALADVRRLLGKPRS